MQRFGARLRVVEGFQYFQVACSVKEVCGVLSFPAFLALGEIRLL